MTFDFGTLIAHLAKTRNLGAGSIIGSGTVSNRDADGGPGKPVDRGGRGYSCLAEVRTVETILDGKPATPFLKAGDTVRIWMDDDARPLRSSARSSRRWSVGLRAATAPLCRDVDRVRLRRPAGRAGQLQA